MGSGLIYITPFVSCDHGIVFAILNSIFYFCVIMCLYMIYAVTPVHVFYARIIHAQAAIAHFRDSEFSPGSTSFYKMCRVPLNERNYEPSIAKFSFQENRENQRCQNIGRQDGTRANHWAVH